MSRLLTVGCVQPTSRVSHAGNAQGLEQAIRALAAQGATLIATPEMTGALDRNRARLLAEARTPDADPTLALVRGLARELSVWVLIGSNPVLPHDGAQRLVNRQFLVSPQGETVASYDKLHMFDVDLPGGESYRESALYDAGSTPVLVKTGIGALGLSICYDLRFGPLYAALAQAGAEILFVPAAFTAVTGAAHWHVLLRARAIETGCYVVAAAQTGTHEDGRTTYGHSLIVDPWGRVLADAGAEPGTILATLDLDAVQETRARIPTLDHARALPPVLTVQG